MFLRNLGLRLLRMLGTPMTDARTGQPLGRVFFIGWRGKLLAIGLENEPPVRPFFLPQPRLTYWKQELGFRSEPLPDFAHAAPPAVHEDPAPSAHPPIAS